MMAASKVDQMVVSKAATMADLMVVLMVVQKDVMMAAYWDALTAD